MKAYIVWGLRILIFLLFLVSGIAKMFPLWAFEKQLVDLGITDWCQAHYLARLIIGLEIALGIAILQGHFLKRIIIPITIFILVAFCIHLSIQMYQHGAMSGNCGCFGQLIPMTPLEAFIKNIITIGLLIYLYRNVTENENSKWTFPAIIYLGSTLLMFLFFPFCPCPEKPKPVVVQNNPQDTLQTMIAPDTATAKPVDTISTKKASTEKKAEPEAERAPKRATSRFAAYTNFSGGVTANLDDGKKIVCLFAAGCDHCQETAKAITEMRKKGGMPPVYILFMDEETNLIPTFFQKATRTYPYQVVSIPQFWPLFGGSGNTPGVFYLWNGNIIQSFEGTGDNKFDAQKLSAALK